MEVAGTPLSAGVAVISDRGTILFWSKGSENITGFTAHEMLGRDLSAVVGSEVHDIEEIVEVLCTSGGRMGMMRRADGTVAPAQWESHAVTLPNGENVYIVLGVSTPATSEVSQNIELHNAFLSQAPFGFAIFDINLRYIMVNEALARINRRPIDDHKGRHISEVIESAELATYERELYHVLETGEPIQNLRFAGFPAAEHAAGQVWSVSWYRLTDPHDTPIGLCGIIFDVTEEEPAILDAARSRAHLSMLADLSTEMTTARDVCTSAQRLTRLLVTGFADYAAVDVLPYMAHGERTVPSSEADASLRQLAVHMNPNEQQVSALSTVKEEKIANALATGKTEFLHDENYAGVISPLKTRGNIFGAITVFRGFTRKLFSTEDYAFLDAVATRAALNLENTRLHAQHEHTAETLQRALLPAEVPDLAEIRIGALYKSASHTVTVGGDWFEVIPLPGRRVMLVLGDVMGHSVESAAAMGRYRTAVVALASVGLSPALLLTRLANLSAYSTTLAACLCVLYDSSRHVCHIASAGNPGPLFISPNGAVEQVACTPGPLLGASDTEVYSAVSVCTPPDSAMLMFSDGVVESRSVSIDQGVERVNRLLSSGTLPDDVDAACEQIIAAAPYDRSDDATVLLAQFAGIS